VVEALHAAYAVRDNATFADFLDDSVE